MMMEFLAFTNEKYRETLEKWIGEAEESDVFPCEVERRMQWVGEFLSKGSSSAITTIPYGVFHLDDDAAICICELVLSDKGQLAGKWLKMLNITLSPKIESMLSQEDLDGTRLAVSIYKLAVIGSMSARLDHDADTLKIYGRNEGQLKFLIALLTFLQEGGSHNLTAKREGRWLVLQTK